MGKLKRFCLIAFALALIIGVGFLAVEYVAYAPLLPYTRAIVSMSWFYVLYNAVLGVIALGTVVLLAVGLFSPGRGKRLEVKRDQGSVIITRTAISSTVRHAIESHPPLKVEKTSVRIKNGRNPAISVSARVNPGSRGDLSSLGQTLQRQVSERLNVFSGARVKRVDIVFAGEGAAEVETMEAARMAEEPVLAVEEPSRKDKKKRRRDRKAAGDENGPQMMTVAVERGTAPNEPAPAALPNAAGDAPAAPFAPTAAAEPASGPEAGTDADAAKPVVRITMSTEGSQQ
ncbi:alkaline shock response membrane anchor protein AmaP [Xiamenia xianingshaonis]|uniref:Alkaline shock response membrane anchor protein AmaP n=1 Tax=Xiamenia xianingshaonis TaxID=2682776 RepID=A0A9E6MPK4_9ACTN|nr:alkaline shock response membrane anchor protein AmaP [Xiamenia xianingshaonis]NHM14963.1 alkaline shock response membrane anchor protein AmaP [Xiamenia xianingshaonis]QTU84018.1 alkaline shock response membrane anchor protein AmaP [Xiamenia xianingshaonis]